jgi:hypothetical protein
MAAYNKFNSFVEDLAEKVHNLGADTLKVALTNSAPVASNTVLANITQIAGSGGYTTGGATVTVSTSAQTSGTYKLVGSLASPTWTASGAFGPFRYAVLYNSTAASSQLIGWWDYGSAITLASGDTFTITLDGTNGILQIV